MREDKWCIFSIFPLTDVDFYVHWFPSDIWALIYKQSHLVQSQDILKWSRHNEFHFIMHWDYVIIDEE